jgi:hypothetical protein
MEPVKSITIREQAMPLSFRINGLVFAQLCLCLPLTAHAVDPQLEACIRKNEPETSATQQIEMRSVDRAGYEKILVADISLKRLPDETARLIACFREPDDIIALLFAEGW